MIGYNIKTKLKYMDHIPFPISEYIHDNNFDKSYIYSIDGPYVLNTQDGLNLLFTQMKKFSGGFNFGYILLHEQTNPVENGVYWLIKPDDNNNITLIRHKPNCDIYKTCYKCQYGDQVDYGYVCINSPAVVGSDKLTFVRTSCGTVAKLQEEVANLKEQLKILTNEFNIFRNNTMRGDVLFI